MARQSPFHAQQAVEKSLKAFLLFHGQPYPITHHLGILADACIAMDESLRSEAGSAVWLTQYAVRFRYPGDPEEPRLEQARIGAAAARLVYQAVLQRVERATRS